MPYGAGMHGSGQGRLRATDADRDRTADALNAAFAEGRLTRDELDARLDQTYRARTYADLDALTGDLPGWMRPGTAAGPGQAVYPAAPGATVPASEVTNGLAIASLCCGLLQVFSFGLSAVPAIVFGYIARGQIRRTGQRGSGLALAGLVLGWLGIALFAVLVIVLVVAAGSLPPSTS